MSPSSEPLSLQLSEPGVTGLDTNTVAYLQSYNLPIPPSCRYGCLFFPSQQDKYKVRLFGQVWLPDQPIGAILFVHGFSEHIGNYGQLIKDFVKAKFAVTCIDLRGHGLSEGPRGHCDGPHYYVEDVEQWLNIIYPSIAPSLPLYIWGHSLGALISLQLLMRNKLPKAASAVTLSSPLLGFPRMRGLQGWLFQLVPLLAKLLPTFPFPTKHNNGADLSSDEIYLKYRLEDPLINHCVTPLWVTSMQRAIQEVTRQPEFYHAAPAILLLLAGNEKVTNLLSARAFAFHALSDLRHKVIEFPNCLHELEKEPHARDRIISESLKWFQSHTL